MYKRASRFDQSRKNDRRLPEFDYFGPSFVPAREPEVFRRGRQVNAEVRYATATPDARGPQLRKVAAAIGPGTRV